MAFTQFSWQKIGCNWLLFLLFGIIMLLCEATLIASWRCAIKFRLDSRSVTFWTSTPPFPSRESWSQATSFSAGKLKSSVKFILTSHRRPNHAEMSVICIFICLTFDPLTGRAAPINVPPLHNQQLTHTGIVCECVCFILSLSCANTIIFHTEGKKWEFLSVHMAWQCVRSIFPHFPHSVCCSSWTRAWNAAELHHRPTGAGSTSKLSNRVNHSCGIL